MIVEGDVFPNERGQPARSSAGRPRRCAAGAGLADLLDELFQVRIRHRCRRTMWRSRSPDADHGDDHRTGRGGVRTQQQCSRSDVGLDWPPRFSWPSSLGRLCSRSRSIRNSDGFRRVGHPTVQNICRTVGAISMGSHRSDTRVPRLSSRRGDRIAEARPRSMSPWSASITCRIVTATIHLHVLPATASVIC